MIVYGIKNCNTVKKALNWLTDHHIQFEFHDFKKLGVSDEKITSWQEKRPWESLINKRGTTWRRLSPEIQELADNSASARRLMRENTSVIKRPVIENGQDLLIGFDEIEYSTKLL